jgi:ATP-dependent helicase IRC3
MQDRPYQDECHAAIRKSYIDGIHHQLVSMATGTGKTIIFAQLPERMGDLLPGQQIVLAHREELIDQGIRKMRAANPTLRIDKEMAGHHADPSTADCIVASVATLGTRNNARLSRYNWERIDKIVTDEAHHSVAPSYLNIYEAATLWQPGNKTLHLGVTATPQRGDGSGLGKIYDRIVYTYSMRRAIEEGWLVEPCGYRLVTGTSLDHVKVTAGDYAVGKLSETVNTPARNKQIVKTWLQNAEGLRTLAFTVDIQHAQDLAKAFQAAGVNAEAVWGDDPDRAAKIAAHKSGLIHILVNCGVLTEGYDDPGIECVILARPTKSSVLFTQMVGRGTRLEEGCDNLLTVPPEWDGKRTCFIIDVVDASSHHSLITLPTLMGMSSGLDLKGQGIVQAVHKLEEVQREYPHIDFTSVHDLDDLDAHIERVNLFDIKFPTEVERSSELSWHVAASGGYVLLLPNREGLAIKQNLLDKWEITGIIHSHRYRGVRDTVEDAFIAADTVIQNNCQESLKLLRREAPWHSEQATPAQLKTLMRFFKGKPLPLDLDKGKASRLISSFLAAKA